jgi:hypothetical protein
MSALTTALETDTGPPSCPQCGSDDLTVLSGDYPTGVVAPDGGQEVRFQCWLKCCQCGNVEEA